MKDKLNSVKNYVAERKVAILTTALVATTTVVVVQQMGLKQHNEFLKEHDLYDEYYSHED